jgi:hypothetical protein
MFGCIRLAAARLALEALDAALAAHLLGLGHLQRHDAPQRRIIRLEHAPERPFAKVAAQLEPPDS